MRKGKGWKRSWASQSSQLEVENSRREHKSSIELVGRSPTHEPIEPVHTSFQCQESMTFMLWTLLAGHHYGGFFIISRKHDFWIKGEFFQPISAIWYFC